MPAQTSAKALHSFFPDSISKTLEAISQDINELRTAIEYSRGYSLTDPFVFEEIDHRILSIRKKADTLRGRLRYTDALAQAIRIFLYLSCDRFSVTSPADLIMLASDLKDILSEPDIRLCSSFELTVWQLFVGGVATTADSETGVWFRITLWRLARAFILREWSGLLVILRRAFMPLLESFNSIWREVLENRSFHV